MHSVSSNRKSEPLSRDVLMKRPAAISLITLFQILTGCCIFFACLRFSPLLAIVGTLISTPAIIRTGVVSNLHFQNKVPFRWPRRLVTFGQSVLLVVVAFLASFFVFSLISMACGMVSVVIASVCGARDMLSDIAVVGTLGGMVWGVAGGMLVMGYCAKWWIADVPPPENQTLPA